MGKTDNGNNIRLRHTFVAMLFALVAGQIALTTADIVQVLQNEAIYNYKLNAAISHLILVVVILTTSWVGWSMSVIKNDETLQLKTVFSRPYIILLIDIMLVVFYFTMVRMVEIGSLLVKNEVTLPLESFKKVVSVGAPSADEEILMLSFIFFLYFVWDIIHDKRVCKRTASSYYIIKTFCNFFVRSWVSGFFFALVFIVGLFIENASDPNDWVFVVLVDVALMTVVLAFRAAKILVRSESDTVNSKVNLEDVKRNDICQIWLFACTILFAITIISALI